MQKIQIENIDKEKCWICNGHGICRQCHHGFVFYPKSDEERIALIEANVYGKGNQHYDPRKEVIGK